AMNVSTNHYTQTGLSQNTRSVIQVRVVTPGWTPGGPVGPLSEAATAYTLATPPIFTELSCPRGKNVQITTGSVVVTWGTRPGGPGPEDNPVTYEIEFATRPWSRTTGEWEADSVFKIMALKYDDLNVNHKSTSTVLEGLNQAVPVFVRGRTLNTIGKSYDRSVNPGASFTDEWTDLISSYDAVGAKPDGADRFTATLPMAPTSFYVISPKGPTSATLSWQADESYWQPLGRLGDPMMSFQVKMTTCTGYEIDGTLQPQFNTSTGPDCGISPSGFDFPSPADDTSEGIWVPTTSKLVTGLKTWTTYYFTISVQGIPHWEGGLPDQTQGDPTTATPLPHYFPYVPGVASGELSVHVTASTGGSVSDGVVGVFDPGTDPPQTQHTVSFSAPGGAFPSDAVLTISTVSVKNDQRYSGTCQGSFGSGIANPCGGDNNMVFELTADPALQPTRAVYFSVKFNSGEPAPEGISMDPKRAVLLRFDPTSCKCVPLRNAGSPTSEGLTAELNHLSIFQVGSWPASMTPESMRIYPNPYYTARESWLTIDQVPANSRVRFFTLRGEMVLDSVADSNGTFYWQGANRGGRAVASGVYLVVVEGNGKKATRKLAVIR
ncbi:MAG: T9SS type A sorting domain-containing protein, partial [Elusimicrobia bacterium]|nr:T9SS type A sorting domain-containing protein [Elusimicrobiota bacterium]